MVCVNSVNVYPSKVTLQTGSWYYGAWAEVCPTYAECTDVSWYSDNPSVASVNATSGYIYARSAGSARIYACATDGSGVSDYITVTVTSKVSVTSVTLNRTSLSLERGDYFALTATVCPENATNRELCWRSANTNVAEVNSGVVTAKASGYAYIYAEATDGSGVYARCYVHVTEDVLVTSVTVSPSRLTMTAGESTYLHAVVCPENAADKSLVWVSSNPSVATVISNSGLVVAQGTGSATITATAYDGSGEYGECLLTVDPPVAVTGVQVCPTSFTMNVGDTATLDTIVCPENATNKRVIWCSSNESVASVDYYTGEITANLAGTATITATTIDGDFQARCMIYVSMPELFKELAESGKISPLDIECTDDGFFMCRKPLSNILKDAGIYALLNNQDEERLCDNFFDDWYLYSVCNGSTDVYSFVKMREQEHENGSDYDNDDPGVTICFVSFNTTIFLNCLYDDSNSNKKALYNEIDRVVWQPGQTHNAVLQQYFNNPASVASYYIAELYIQYIADSANGSQINLPNKYLDRLEDIASYERAIEQLEGRTDSDSQISLAQLRAQLEKLSRVPKFIASINQSAGYAVCDDEKIAIQSSCCLSTPEKYAILATHTDNVSLNSFAAEVKYHAYALETWYGKVNLLDAYEKAIRADMAIGEGNLLGIGDDFYDLNSDIVQEQILYHGEK